MVSEIKVFKKSILSIKRNAKPAMHSSPVQRNLHSAADSGVSSAEEVKAIKKKSISKRITEKISDLHSDVKTFLGSTFVKLNNFALLKPELLEHFSGDFISKKEIFISSISKIADKKILSALENAKTPQEMASVIKKLKTDLTIEVNKTFGIIMKDSSTLSFKEKSTILNQIMKKHNETVFAVEKGLKKVSTNPEVLKIQEELINKYGIKYIDLKDDLAQARKVLESYKLLERQGADISALPKNIIVSHTISMGAAGQYLSLGKGESAILIQSSKVQKQLCGESGLYGKKMFINNLSTQNPLHHIIHEICHGLQPQNLKAYSVEIPAHLQKAAKTVSKYGRSTKRELWAELSTKHYLEPERLTKEETQLYEYLKNSSLY